MEEILIAIAAYLLLSGGKKEKTPAWQSKAPLAPAPPQTDEPAKVCPPCTDLPEATDDAVTEVWDRAVATLDELRSQNQGPPAYVQNDQGLQATYSQHVGVASAYNQTPLPWAKWWVHAVFWMLYGVPANPAECCVIGEPWKSRLDEIADQVGDVVADAIAEGVPGWEGLA